MVMNHMIHMMKQMTSKLSPSVYTSAQQQNSAAQLAHVRQLQKELKRENVLEVPLDDLQFIVFDLETTGFHPNHGDKILSIGAVKMRGDKIIEDDTFYSLVNAEKVIPEHISKLTGITNEQLEDAPPIREVLQDFYKYIQRDTLVAHHSKHEQSFMQHTTWSVLRTNFKHRILDTSFLTKITLPREKLTSLDDFCRHYQLESCGRHHALKDAKLTAEVWGRSVSNMKELGFKNLSEVYVHLAKMK
ncbi:exonuclease domain-containing protein [Bacillus sp. FJAT-45350]|uniref:exonuclease domain-containing protein n=1 Tax=Bacillus sp. FJAT-45350 TaxID=2011014 RepID=UPI000BB8D341|nr:exonuclease domain-containing protein [Bacillus sp. FJAT-45350]